MTINAEIHKHQEPSKELRVYFSNKDARQFPKPARLGDILYIKKWVCDYLDSKWIAKIGSYKPTAI